MSRPYHGQRKAKRISLGDYAAMTGEQARAAALDARAKAQQGEAVRSHAANAKAARQAARAKTVAEAQASTSLHDLLFVDAPDRKSFDAIHWHNLKSGSAAANLIRNLMGDGIHRPAIELTPRIMEQIFTRKIDTAPHIATRAITYLAPAIKHLAVRGHVAMGLLDLCHDHKVATVKRDRVLKQDEWVSIWNALEDKPQDNAVRVLMLTGARNREVADMRPNELHLDKAEWHLPTDRSKNSDPHIFTLPPRAVEILRAQIAHNHDVGYDGGKVFTNDR